MLSSSQRDVSKHEVEFKLAWPLAIHVLRREKHGIVIFFITKLLNENYTRNMSHEFRFREIYLRNFSKRLRRFSFCSGRKYLNAYNLLQPKHKGPLRFWILLVQKFYFRAVDSTHFEGENLNPAENFVLTKFSLLLWIRNFNSFVSFFDFVLPRFPLVESQFCHKKHMPLWAKSKQRTQRKPFGWREVILKAVQDILVG